MLSKFKTWEGKFIEVKKGEHITKLINAIYIDRSKTH